MAYSFQTFVASSVFTSAQANQIEINIRDHVHGADGVGPVGLSWIRESKSAGFTAAGSDAGKMFDCTGDFTVDFASAATLGDGWAASFKNVGSGRIALVPFGTQNIDATSFFAVTPQESINVYSDAANLLTFGHTKGWFLLQDFFFTSSRGSVNFDKIYGSDFASYKIEISEMGVTSLTVYGLRVSVDSGSTFIATDYTNNTGSVSHSVILINGNINSTAICHTSIQFNPPTTRRATAFQIRSTLINSNAVATQGVLDGAWWPNSGTINGLQIFPTSAAFSSIRATLWGLR